MHSLYYDLLSCSCVLTVWVVMQSVGVGSGHASRSRRSGHLVVTFQLSVNMSEVLWIL